MHKYIYVHSHFASSYDSSQLHIFAEHHPILSPIAIRGLLCVQCLRPECIEQSTAPVPRVRGAQQKS